MSKTETINIQISPGEAIDRWRILCVKQLNVGSEELRKCCSVQLDYMKAAIDEFESDNGLRATQLSESVESYRMFAIHQSLWELEDEIRNAVGSCANNELRPTIVSIHELNAERAKLKNEITERFGDADDQEIKQYAGATQNG